MKFTHYKNAESAIFSAVYFLGTKGLAGEDHFFPGDYRSRNLVKKGIYRYINHPVYTVGVLFEWGVFLMVGSFRCFLLAVTGHVSALAFLYCTEIPDMKFIYGKQYRKLSRGTASSSKQT